MSLLIVKGCSDFVPLKDGTLKGDERYCELSFKCKQVGMESKYVELTMPNGEAIYDFLCTGCKIKDKEENTELIKAT